ncbi:hypothetical protein AB835_14255 [Candidatus Endobugula sertula]|uniref:Uncharacterized protein n=1 Tax=Candidatus Endobugula sertula TaxID=62101 RepID=A0A1D2QLI2_9GAMM|nr:hypothetical protein AB835_14255 [Candidatus Endobugula sertula]
MLKSHANVNPFLAVFALLLLSAMLLVAPVSGKSALGSSDFRIDNILGNSVSNALIVLEKVENSRLAVLEISDVPEDIPSTQTPKNSEPQFSGGRPTVDGDPSSPEVSNRRSAESYDYYDGSNPNRGTLTNVEAREWYIAQEARIPSLIDKSAPLENQARQAFELRNGFRTEARDRQADRASASGITRENPNLTWEQVNNRARRRLSDNGVSNPTNDQIFQEIIGSSQRSRESVNRLLEIK